MSGHSLERKVNADPAKVWAMVTDVNSFTDIIRGITEVERLDDLPQFGIGTRWRETRKMFGSEATEEMAVTHLNPQESYTVEAESRGAHYTSVISVKPSGDGSSLKMTFDSKPTGKVAWILANTIGRLFENAIRKTHEHDLDDIATAAEAR